jgi:hypothetical protein
MVRSVVDALRICALSFLFRTDRAAGQHNANTVGNAKPIWIANALNGYGVIRFVKASKMYLDLNPVSYLNQKSAYSIFFIARLLDFPATTGVQYLFSDSGNGMRVFFNGSRWCVDCLAIYDRTLVTFNVHCQVRTSHAI